MTKLSGLNVWSVLVVLIIVATAVSLGEETSEVGSSSSSSVGSSRASRRSSDKRLRVMRAYLLGRAGGLGQQPQHQRERRSLKDVEKMMIEDEFMALLICEACGRHSCIPDYCRYCEVCFDDDASASASGSGGNSPPSTSSSDKKYTMF